jgi:hypothetical protein
MGTIARVAVMGSRDFTDQETVAQILTKTSLALCDPQLDGADRPQYHDVILVLGGANGVEACARRWADDWGDTSYVLYKPHFMVDRKSEGFVPRDFPIRRTQMVDNCDVLVVIHNGNGEDFSPYIRRAMAQGKTVITEEVHEV